MLVQKTKVGKSVPDYNTISSATELPVSREKERGGACIVVAGYGSRMGKGDRDGAQRTPVDNPHIGDLSGTSV